MNRLIIIGNGFDLAHGLKTSFKDFIADYLVDVIDNLHRRLSYDDILLGLSYYQNSGYAKTEVNKKNSIDIFKEILKDRDIVKDFKSPFIENILKKITQVNWVDIEMEFYKALILCKDGHYNVRVLNEQFEFLKLRLFEYLKVEEGKFNREMLTDKLLDCFREVFISEEIITQDVSNTILHTNLLSKAICVNWITCN